MWEVLLPTLRSRSVSHTETGEVAAAYEWVALQSSRSSAWGVGRPPAGILAAVEDPGDYTAARKE